MNPAKRALARTKQFVSDHKTAIAVGTTVVVCGVLHRKVVKATNERLIELGISLDTFYNAED